MNERLMFAIELLKGDLEARWILADYLEEQGDRHMAGWARSKNTKRVPRLDFVLATLPLRDHMVLTIDMIQHGLLGTNIHYLQLGIDRIEQWLKNHEDHLADEGLSHLSNFTAPRINYGDFRCLEQVSQSLHIAIGLAKHLIPAVDQIEVNRHSVQQCRGALRKSLKASRVFENKRSALPTVFLAPSQTQSLFGRIREDGVTALFSRKREIDWQIEHVIEYITKKIEGE